MDEMFELFNIFSENKELIKKAIVKDPRLVKKLTKNMFEPGPNGEIARMLLNIVFDVPSEEFEINESLDDMLDNGKSLREISNIYKNRKLIKTLPSSIVGPIDIGMGTVDFEVTKKAKEWENLLELKKLFILNQLII